MWHSSAPRQLARTYSPLDLGAGGDRGNGENTGNGASSGNGHGTRVSANVLMDAATPWQSWVDHLQSRSKPARLQDLLESGREALTWCLKPYLEPEQAARIAAWQRPPGGRGESDQTRKERLEALCADWLSRPCGQDSGVGDLVEAIAVVHALPAAAAVLGRGTWWAVLTQLVETAQAADAAVVHEELDPLQALQLQLAAGELPLTIGHVFGELKLCRKLRDAARKPLSSGPLELLDAEGMPHARYLPILRPLLACWTRCTAIGKSHKKRCFDHEAENQYEWFVRQMIRFTRGDGTQLLSSDGAGAWSQPLFAAAIRLVGDEDDLAAARIALPGKIAGRRDEGYPPVAAAESEWGAIAILRSDFTRKSPKLAVTYLGNRLQLELEAARETLIAGDWQTQIKVNGKTVGFAGEWEQNCWFSDDDVDYLELSIGLDGGGVLERQMLLAREDEILFLQDLVVGVDAGVQYRGALPLASSIAATPLEETREVLLTQAKGDVLLMPLALNEWRRGDQSGQLSVAGDELVLEQHTAAGNLACPLFFDLAPRRAKKPHTWRQLTVAESLEMVPRDVAVGFRVQAGSDQWLIYRALTRRGNRTLLGYNLSSEFYFGRLDRDGEADELLEIEG